MSWFLYALICVLGWGTADLLYKKSSDETDRYSHLKIAVWVGLVMGACALLLMPMSSGFTLASLGRNAIRYLPASLCYILSMVIGYAGLRYLELSIVSPVQNSSGALAMLCMLVYFAVMGRRTGAEGSLWEQLSALDLAGTGLIVAGMIALAVVEQRLAAEEQKALYGKQKAGAGARASEENLKYRYGALALIFPVLYCIFDTLGTAADGIILDEELGLGLSEVDVLILYGLTFLLAGLVSYLVLRVKTGHWYRPFGKAERPKAGAALCEEFGQVFYVYAMAGNPVLAAPMVASYCIISVLLSRVALKEKLTGGQYLCIIAVILGILCLGISEGLAEG